VILVRVLLPWLMPRAAEVPERWRGRRFPAGHRMMMPAAVYRFLRAVQPDYFGREVVASDLCGRPFWRAVGYRDVAETLRPRGCHRSRTRGATVG